MAGDAVEVEFQLTVDDLVAFNRNVAIDNKSDSVGFSFVQFRGPIIVALLLLGFCFVLPQKGLIAVQFISGFLTCALFILMVTFVLRQRSFKLHFKKMLISDNISKRKLIIDSEFVKEITKYSDYTIGWRGFERVQKVGDLVFLYTTNISALVVPKRAFADDAAFERFYQKCQEYFNAARGKTPESGAA
ncbi:MAG: YcxB family protein [Alphaproteobacteria bacterium]|nr:YcxB family protein [Alphaproteobacteria bacterium]QQS56540.1 MAG: YcxB family protein [Alphaproteobacteria bacterium]